MDKKQKGYISETVSGGRLVSHGKIESLSQGFKLPKSELFSIYIRPKENVTEFDTVLKVKCYQDNDFAEAPFGFNDWSPLLISEIAPNDTLLNTCDVYWGSGQFVEG